MSIPIEVNFLHGIWGYCAYFVYQKLRKDDSERKSYQMSDDISSILCFPVLTMLRDTEMSHIVYCRV